MTTRPHVDNTAPMPADPVVALLPVTQADRDAVQAFHRTMLDRLMSDVKSQRPKLGDDEGDAGTLVQAFARHRLAHRTPAPTGDVQSERDTAQSLVEAWASVCEGLEAHLMDRVAMQDEANPAAYLSILRSSMANVQRFSEQVRAARWADYKRQNDEIDRLRDYITTTDGAVSGSAEVLRACPEVLESKNDCCPSVRGCKQPAISEQIADSRERPAPHSPTGETLLALAERLTQPQQQALLLSADGWALSFYMPYGAMQSDRGGAVGKPYWMMKPGQTTPKAPHWATAIALQTAGLIEPGSDAMPCTPRGREVAAALRARAHQETSNDA